MTSMDDIQFSYPTVSGLKTRVASVGEGPVVLLLHGWPECWYSWRRQMIALADAGFRAVAPDMPGFGETDRLPNCEDYNIARISEFLIELIATVSDQPVILIGHDWGATNAWNFTLRHPEAVATLVNLSVPLRAYGKVPPTELFRERFGNRFFYQLYFQKPQRPEAEFDADPVGILSRLYCSPDTPREPATLKNAPADEGGWIARMGKPKEIPAWLSADELDYYVAAYQKSGFAGGIHYYRNIDKNWELMAPFEDSTIACPTLFVAGSEDVSIQHASEEQLAQLMQPRVPNIEIHVLASYGHWIQQEATAQVDKLIIDFLKK